MSKEEKKKYDIDGIANVFRNGMFGMALIILLGYFISELTEIPAIEEYAFVAALIIGVPYLILKANSKRFKLK